MSRDCPLTSHDNSIPGIVTSLQDINIRSVGNIKDEKGNFVYPQINELYQYQK